MIREGTRVSWAWCNRRGKGTVREIFRSPVTRTIKGTEISRNGSELNPAYLIRQDDGDEVLKLQSEVEAEN